MKILHVIPSLSSSQGGPSLALPAMARALAALGIDVDVATTDDDGHGRRLPGIVHACPTPAEGFRIFYFPKQTEFYKVSGPMLLWLLRHAAHYDLIHIHAVFTFATFAAGWAARLRHVPYVVRPLGVLNSWGMENRRRGLKACSFRFLDKPILDHAAAVHYTSDQERDEAARLAIRAPACVIPLGFDLSAALPQAAPEIPSEQPRPKIPTVLYLSRLDPKKNVERLLEAFAQMPAKASLMIAGGGPAPYVASLKLLADKLGIGDRVLWPGHLQGAAKSEAYAAASLFVLPSMSENFGIALLEAMAAGLPCISTPGVALAAEAARSGAVELVSPSDAGALATVMNRLLADADARAALAMRGRDAAAQYSLETMGRRLERLYQNHALSTSHDHHRH